MTAKIELSLLERRHVDAVLARVLGFDYDWPTYLKLWACRTSDRRHAGIKGSAELCLHPCAYKRTRSGQSKVPLYREKDIAEFIRKFRARFPGYKPSRAAIKRYSVDADLLASPICPANWVEATPV
ncbi:MAG: hypothetical protein RSE32_16295 [Comamonas sp.]|uniref:hypothetical protein n=1 Tax=Comamonas sp. TaxID=34028 RepID=UPI002FCC5DAA